MLIEEILWIGVGGEGRYDVPWEGGEGSKDVILIIMTSSR